MRELALITFRIVDETCQFRPAEVAGLYTRDYPGDSVVAASHMRRLSKFDADEATLQAADGYYVLVPKAQMTTIRVEACNFDSALGGLILDSAERLVAGCLTKLTSAGLKLLDHENDDRSRLHDMSKTLGGDGVEPTDMVQFYAVFNVSFNSDKDTVEAALEGVLRLDKIDMAIDEAILL